MFKLYTEFGALGECVPPGLFFAVLVGFLSEKIQPPEKKSGNSLNLSRLPPCAHMRAVLADVSPFTFYAARKSWGTLGRKLGIEKATIDEGLAHVGDFPLTDIYAKRNWQLAWDANRRVLDLFRW